MTACRTIWAVLLALSLLPQPLMAEDVDTNPPQEAVADDDARRQKMIGDCEENRGVDCEREVDTELEAQATPQHQGVGETDTIRRPVLPRPRPAR